MCILHHFVSQAMLNVFPNSSATNMQTKSMDAAENMVMASSVFQIGV